MQLTALQARQAVIACPSPETLEDLPPDRQIQEQGPVNVWPFAGNCAFGVREAARMGLLEIVRASLREIAAPDFRALLWRTILLTFLLLLVIGGLLAWAVNAFVLDGAMVRALANDYPWAQGIIYFVAGAGFFFIMFVIALPILRFVAGRFAGQIAEIVEKNHETRLPPRLGAVEAPADTLRFTLRTWLLNIVLLPLALVPVVGFAILFAVNGYNLGREYYALASNRYRDPPQTEARRKRRRLLVWGGGMVIAALSSVPILNLLAPAYGVLLMLELDRRFMGEETSG
jgi:CysZ protein